MLVGRHDLWRLIAARLALPMFVLSLTFLICQAILVVVWVDVPTLSENVEAAFGTNSAQVMNLRASLEQEITDDAVNSLAIFLVCVIWPIVILEAIFHWTTRPWDSGTRRYHFFSFLFCLCPSLRMCARSPEMGGRLWLPGLGWRQSNKRLRRRLERHFSFPMICIALLIMPVLIIEFFMKTQVAQYAWLRFLLHLSTGVIWFAFAAEFILMSSVADKKLQYCKKHWIDLAIILLPLFSFMRSLRVLRATKALKVQHVTKLARVYRLRGTTVKALRALILLEFFTRITGNDIDRKIEKLQTQLDEVEEQAKEIRRAIARLERTHPVEETSDETSKIIA